MKKILALLLVAVMCLSLVACGGGETSNTNDNNETLGNNSATNGTVDDTGNNNTETGDNTTENPVLLYDGSGKAWFNKKVLPDLVETIELTTENWREYIKAYSYNIEKVEKDPFGEVVSTQIITRYMLGAGNERYHFFNGVAIELKNKETGELTIYELDDIGYSIAADFNLDNYECTRIQGNLYFLNFPDEIFSVSDSFGFAEKDGEEILYYSIMYSFALEEGTKAIHTDSCLTKFFE